MTTSPTGAVLFTFFAAADPEFADLVRRSKQRGQEAELRFAAMAASKGVTVTLPYGNVDHFDVVVWNGRKFIRVQVKAGGCLRDGSYRVPAFSHGRRYSCADIDILAAYIYPLDAWYLIPASKIDACFVRLYPHLGPNDRGPGGHRYHRRFERYRDAWHLLL